MEKNCGVYEYFTELSLIPRQSGDEEKVGTFLLEFAKARGLKTKRDKQGNILICRPSTIEGYKGPGVILQGHMDMVYEKAADSDHIYEHGISVKEEDGFLLSADGTTLGADNGIALAYVMDLMDRRDLKLPPLEFLLTTEEEVGLVGVKNLELTGLKGKYLINLDAEEEGVFLTSCAGGVRTELALPLIYEPFSASCTLELVINGLKGGHSGLEIGLERANAVKLLGRILYRTKDLGRVGLIESPGKANAIASRGKILYYIRKENAKTLAAKLRELENELAKEFSGREEISFEIQEKEISSENVQVLSGKFVEQICCLSAFLPCGVINRVAGETEKIETSSNIGALTMTGDSAVFLCSSRSSEKSRKEELKDRMSMLADTFGAECRFFGEYPQWTYRKVSKLREICREAYLTYSGKEPIFTGVHAGLECGYLSEKLGDEIDMISFGADLSDVHTPRERANIGSIHRIEEVLIEILRRICEENS